MRLVHQRLVLLLALTIPAASGCDDSASGNSTAAEHDEGGSHEGHAHDGKGPEGEEAHEGDGHEGDGHEGDGHEGDGHEGDGHSGEGEPAAGHGGHAEQGEHPKHVELGSEALQHLDLRIEPARAGRLEGTVSAPATIEHDVERVAHISPLVEGQVERLRASLGDTVESGQVVAVMHSVALGKARSQVAEAEAALEVAQLNFERQKKLRDEGIASERAFIEAKGRLREAEARHSAALARLRTFGARGGGGPTYPLRSRIDGTIIEQHASIGETKSPSDVLFVVADQSRVWAMGRVYERDVDDVELGMKAIVRLDAYPGRSFEGRVDWTASTVDEETRNLPVRVELDNPDGVLRPGLFGRMRLMAADVPMDRALIPVDAVQALGEQKVVFVPGDGEGKFEVVPVELGAEGDRLVEILSGLEPKQKVVVKGAFDLLSALTASTRSAAHHH